MSRPPLIKECLANIECRSSTSSASHNIVVLEAVAAHVTSARKEKRTCTPLATERFIVDGRPREPPKADGLQNPPGV